MPQTIFLDTSSLRQANFSLTGVSFHLLAALAEAGTIAIVTTDITLLECEALIRAQTEIAVSAIKRAQQECQLLNNLGARVLAEPLAPDAGQIAERAMTSLRAYFSPANATILMASQLSGRDAFDRYFHQKPPFGPGKKKSEFPDAFVLQALAAEALRLATPIEVVSADPDFKAALAGHEHLRHHDSLSSLLAGFHALPDADFAKATALYRTHREELQRRVSAAIENDTILLADSPGEVETFELQALELEEPRLTTISEDGIASYEVLAQGTVRLEVSIPREGSYIYDSEDKVGGYSEWNSGEIERELEVIVEFSLPLDLRGTLPTPLPLTLNHGGALEVFLSEDPNEYFK